MTASADPVNSFFGSTNGRNRAEAVESATSGAWLDLLEAGICRSSRIWLPTLNNHGPNTQLFATNQAHSMRNSTLHACERTLAELHGLALGEHFTTMRQAPKRQIS